MTKQGVLSRWQRVKSQDVHESSEKGGVNQQPHIKNCDCKIICRTLGWGQFVDMRHVLVGVSV